METFLPAPTGSNVPGNMNTSIVQLSLGNSVAPIEHINLGLLTQDIKALNGSGVGNEGGSGSKIKPSGNYDINAKPRGIVTTITDKMDDATKRSLIRENEAAETIARNGYDIEQNPVINETTRNPDYIIEGKVFDCYAPASNTKVRNVASTIEEKVIKKGQTNNIVLNLDDWNGNVEDLIKQLNDYPVGGLEEVMVVKNGKIILLYP